MSEQNDLISRQQAIDALRRLRGNWNNADNAVDKCISTIDLLPPAQPQRIHGHWTEDNSCPFCGKQPWYKYDIHTLSFCPYCGADMREENNESD